MFSNAGLETLTSMLAMPNFGEWGANLWSILQLVIGFSLVIFVHELGHFWAAKWAKVRVERFAIGFGKELFGFTRGETRYSFNVLPLGGYVKMLGQEDFVVDKSGELKVKADPNSFTNKTIGQRMVIVSAGVIMNLIFAAIAFAIVVMVGRPQQPSVVGEVVQNSAAGRAGLQTGDRIAAVNGREIKTFEEFTYAVVLADVDEPLELDVLRDGKLLTPKPKVLPEYKKDQSVRQVGLSSGRTRRVFIPTFGAVQSYRENELQPNDELYKLVLSGEAKEFKDLGVFSRAMVEARGEPIQVIVRRPVNPTAIDEQKLTEFEPDIETKEVPVSLQAVWVPAAYELGDTVTGSLLGLVPRLTILFPQPDKSFAKAGAESGDVIVRIDGEAFPNYELVRKTIQEHPDKPISLEVRRSRASNGGISAEAVHLLVQNREDLIAAARKEPGSAGAKLNTLLTQAGLPDEQKTLINERTAGLTDARAWRRWLENVDVHKLDPLIPRSNFVLLGTPPPPAIDATLRTIDEDHLVVADVREKLGDRESPAHAAGIPAGAVILAVDKQPVRKWYQLSEALRQRSGKSAEITYRVSDDVKTATMMVPMSISAALNLNAGTRITKIDGRDSSVIADPSGKSRTVYLPDWMAVREILKSSIGKSVKVEYSTINAVEGSGTYEVTADNIDPWLMRIHFIDQFYTYPLVERNQISNPILAAGEGFRQAYLATLQTIRSIEHMVFTRQVGLNKVSGPVGIVRIGSKVADAGPLNLLWFLAVISANLAVINFLPMPIVDGGLFLFLILEKIRGEPVSIKTQVATQLIGIALIATLFILVTYQDIKNWITGA